ncbi:hypothetical protein AVEN_95113-1 [Araneus ventricosus]|uniref:Uncharacterized protein n=1 Tax=Araneus ventricosus TaxID=182803 RepID=A0A4Y2I8M5_ARAVE|nr:hypothetical protein AVEN_95113-1 [Araneus ventricosus]
MIDWSSITITSPPILRNISTALFRSIVRDEKNPEWDFVHFPYDTQAVELCAKYGYVNTKKCRIWATENPFGHQSELFHSEKSNYVVWVYGIVYHRAILFEDIGSVTCMVNGVRYESPLRSHVIPALQQRACIGSTIFIQDGASPRIANLVKRLISMHF